jgi:hypothetical protein
MLRRFVRARAKFRHHKRVFELELRRPRVHKSSLPKHVARVYKWSLVLQPSTHVRWFAHRTWDGSSEEATRISKRLEAYMLLATPLLVLGLFSSGVPIWRWVAVVFAGIRLLEIFAVSVELILGWLRVSTTAAIATVGVYTVQAVMIFAIFARVVGSDGFSDSNNKRPDGIGDFVYMIWNSMATLGNSYSADSGCARLVITMSNLTAILIFSVLLGYAVGKLGDRQTENPEPDEPI